MQGSRLPEETAAKSSQEGIGTKENGRAVVSNVFIGSSAALERPACFLCFSASAWQEAPETEDSLADETKQTDDENDC